MYILCLNIGYVRAKSVRFMSNIGINNLSLKLPKLILNQSS